VPGVVILAPFRPGREAEGPVVRLARSADARAARAALVAAVAAGRAGDARRAASGEV
jgi:hypothetical protein